MTARTLNRRFVGATLAAAAFGAFSAGSVFADNGTKTVTEDHEIEVAGVQTGLLMANDPAPTAAVAQLEMDFLSGMIPHHRQAMQMAKMATEKATQGELKQFAQHLWQTQSMQLEKMTAYLRDWYGQLDPQEVGASEEMMDKVQSPLLHGEMPDFASRMVLLQMAEGKDFDKEFLNTMAVHHAASISMAAPVLIDAYHAGLHDLAEQMVVEQGQQIKQLDQWLESWYGQVRPS